MKGLFPTNKRPPMTLEPLPLLAGDAARVLQALHLASVGRSLSLISAERIAGQLGIATSTLLFHLRELERARLVEHWPTGAAVYLTERGRVFAEQISS